MRSAQAIGITTLTYGDGGVPVAIGAAGVTVSVVVTAIVGLALNQVIGDLKGLLLSIGVSDEMTAKLVANSGWRILMLFGVLPAILTLLIQIFVPESHKWQEEKQRGSTQAKRMMQITPALHCDLAHRRSGGQHQIISPSLVRRVCSLTRIRRSSSSLTRSRYAKPP